jgi:hypothetical protein
MSRAHAEVPLLLQGRPCWVISRHTSSLPQRKTRPGDVSSSARRGRGECRAPIAPAALRAKIKSTQVSHHGRAGITRHSRTRMVLTVSFALSPETGLIVSVASGSSHQFDISIGMSGPHDFAVRLARVRLCAPKRPPHPAPNVRDDRETPLVRARDGGAYGFDLGKTRSDLFLRRWLDR